MTEKTQEEKEINLKQAGKLLDLENDPKLVFFDELRDLNKLLGGVIIAVNSSKTDEIAISNTESMITDLSPLETKIDDLNETLKQLITATEKEDIDIKLEII